MQRLLLAASTILFLRMSVGSNIQIFWNKGERGALGSGKRREQRREMLGEV